MVGEMVEEESQCLRVGRAIGANREEAIVSSSSIVLSCFKVTGVCILGGKGQEAGQKASGDHLECVGGCVCSRAFEIITVQSVLIRS